MGSSHDCALSPRLCSHVITSPINPPRTPPPGQSQLREYSIWWFISKFTNPSSSGVAPGSSLGTNAEPKLPGGIICIAGGGGPRQPRCRDPSWRSQELVRQAVLWVSFFFFLHQIRPWNALRQEEGTRVLIGGKWESASSGDNGFPLVKLECSHWLSLLLSNKDFFRLVEGEVLALPV